MIQVVTDSVADIPTETVERLGITVIPAHVTFGQETFRDGVDLSRDEFYAKLMSSRVMPMTAAPSIGEYEAVYRRLAGEGDEVVSIQMAGNLSAIYSVARVAAESATAATGVRVHVIDTGQATMGVGWMAVAAAEAAREGRTLDEVVALVENIKPRSHVLALLDQLEYVHRGGRVSWAQALIGTVLRIKPMIDVHMGDVHLLERTRSMERALVRLISRVRGLGAMERAMVVHAKAPALAEHLAAQLQAVYPAWQPLITQAGVTIATHAGPGAVGIALVTGG